MSKPKATSIPSDGKSITNLKDDTIDYITIFVIGMIIGLLFLFGIIPI